MIFRLFLLINLFLVSGCISANQRTPAQVACVVGQTGSCPENKECAKLDSGGKTGCVDAFPEPDLVFQFPFDKNTEVICTQSPKNPNGSHGFSNSLYALDLTTPYSKPASVIRASADGKAFVFNECKNPKGNPAKAEIDNCGLGWGNHVRILHKNGIVSFYVHFENISIKDGQLVKAGDILGVEGWTGLAGHRHLHWDVHKLNGTTTKEWEKILSNPGWGGISIPYFFEVYMDGKKQIVSSKDLKCRHDDMTQPPWKGTK